MSTLLEAIDRTVEYVRKHPDTMTRAEVDEFEKLADEVHQLASPIGLDKAFPDIFALTHESKSNDLSLPPVQFISKLNLPGDWDNSITDCEQVFLVTATRRWFNDMDMLRRLATPD